MSKLRTVVAGAALATALTGGLVGVAATSASASTDVTTVAPVLTHHKGKCVWIGSKGKVRLGYKVRKTTVVWRNGNWHIKRYWGCNVKKKWTW